MSGWTKQTCSMWIDDFGHPSVRVSQQLVQESELSIQPLSLETTWLSTVSPEIISRVFFIISPAMFIFISVCLSCRRKCAHSFPWGKVLWWGNLFLPSGLSPVGLGKGETQWVWKWTKQPTSRLHLTCLIYFSSTLYFIWSWNGCD